MKKSIRAILNGLRFGILPGGTGVPAIGHAGMVASSRNRHAAQLLLPLVLFLFTLPAVLQAQFSYKIINGTITITGYTGSSNRMVIPSTIGGLPVTSIGDQAFYGNYSFYSVTIPNSVTNIGGAAFFNCYNLTSVTIGSGVVSMGESVFYECNSLRNVTIPNGIAAIAPSTFRECWSLSSVTIPSSVRSIGADAFGGCRILNNVTLPNGVTNIGEFAFYGCWSLTQIAIPEGVSKIAGFTFRDCYQLAHISIPGSVTSIGADAFYECFSLTNFTVGRSITNIGEGAFAACIALNSIGVDALNTAYTSVDGVLFDKSLATLVAFPAGKSGDYTIPDTVSEIDGYAFYYCTNLSGITLPDSITGIGDYAFGWCFNLVSLSMGNGIKSIGSEAFEYCGGLRSATLPNSATNLGSGAFSVCFDLRTITIGDGLTKIEGSMFGFCTNLSRVTLGRNIAYLGDYSFPYCYSLAGIYFHGNAPALSDSSVFIDSTNATIYYLPGTTGWGPTFGGLPTALWNLPPAPTISCPAALSVGCTNGTAIGTLRAEVLDTNGYALEVIWTVDGTPYQTNQIRSTGLVTASNVTFTANFPSGEHVVVISASNGQVAPATCSTTVVVADAIPPEIVLITASSNVLWPPNGRMVPIRVIVEAVDACDPSPVVRITKVTSNEPQNPLTPDWQITGPQSLNLRAERLGKGKGRVYTIEVQCEDANGNVSSGSINVTVPHNWNSARSDIKLHGPGQFRLATPANQHPHR
jgi:hypothetical protein